MIQMQTHNAQERTAALVVDDDPILRSVVASKLSAFVSDIVEAEDGADALRKCTEHKLKIALVDLEMPNIDGITLIQCIRSHPDTRHLPVVVITGRQDSEALRAALHAGATSYLTKPVNWSMFSHHVEHLIALSEAQMRADQCLELAEAALELASPSQFADLEKAREVTIAVRDHIAASNGDGPLIDAMDQVAGVLEAQHRRLAAVRDRVAPCDKQDGRAIEAA
ncbi:MAG: response regulator [Pseudomonadota bacterium]